MPRFLNCPVEGQIEWPRSEVTFLFGEYQIIVFPASRERDASIHIDLQKHKLSNDRGMSIFCQILSIAVWLDDTYAVLLEGWSGNPIPVRPGPPRRATSIPSSLLDSWPNSWGPIQDEQKRRALAIYREAVNMTHYHSQPYAVLGFYKIIEAAIEGPRRRAFLEAEIARMLASDEIGEYQLRYVGFSKATSPEEIADFLYVNGRHAVAHAQKEPAIDPDDWYQIRSMSVAASILRQISRRYVEVELGLGTERWGQ